MHSSIHPIRRRLLALALAPLAAPLAAVGAGNTEIEVWKSPTCGCCGDWVEHLRANGFAVKVNDVGNPGELRQKWHMPDRYGSCHTARVAGYTIEGHVPAADIRRLLQARPAAVGLSVPGMPVGSPGMDAPVYGGRRDPFDVLLVQRDGSAKVFSSYFKEGKK